MGILFFNLKIKTSIDKLLKNIIYFKENIKIFIGIYQNNSLQPSPLPLLKFKH